MYFEDTMPGIDLTMSAELLRSCSCVYTHTSLEGELMFVGNCLLSEVFTAPDAHRNSEWINLFLTIAMPFKLSILLISADSVKCQNMAGSIARDKRPRCNVYGTRTTQGRVQCIETGAIYQNAAQACRVMDISSAAMSNHLNKRPHCKTIKGFTFKRI